METVDHIYIRILTWAYEKQQEGFTRDELNQEFDLQGDIYTWVDDLFFHETPGSGIALISRLFVKDEKDYFALTRQGIAAAVDYLELKEVKENSKQAKTIAYWSIGIGVVVGIVQIVVGVVQIMVALYT